jgi:hypothetical protein
MKIEGFFLSCVISVREVTEPEINLEEDMLISDIYSSSIGIV